MFYKRCYYMLDYRHMLNIVVVIYMLLLYVRLYKNYYVIDTY